MSLKTKITLIGSGNVATALAIAFKKKGCVIHQIYSPNLKHAKELAKKVNAEGIDKIKKVKQGSNFYIVAVNDTEVEKVLSKLDKVVKDAVVLHTSGSVSVGKGKNNHFGVLYPLQTITKTKAIDWSIVPVCIECENKAALKKIKQLAGLISKKTQHVNSGQRLILHVSAVLACNFTNALYVASETLLKKHKLPFDMLKPLILETAGKIMDHSPKNVQTGPAKRGDLFVMKKHQQVLKKDKQLSKLYKLLSNLIVSQQKNN